MEWFYKNKPIELTQIFLKSQAKAGSNSLIAKGEWEGSGYLYKIKAEKVNFKTMRKGFYDSQLNGRLLNLSLKGEDKDSLKLYLRIASDTLVFTRFYRAKLNFYLTRPCLIICRLAFNAGAGF